MAYNNLGYAYENFNDFQAAICHYQKACDLDKTNSTAKDNYNIAVINLYKLKNIKNVIQATG